MKPVWVDFQYVPSRGKFRILPIRISVAAVVALMEVEPNDRPEGARGPMTWIQHVAGMSMIQGSPEDVQAKIAEAVAASDKEDWGP